MKRTFLVMVGVALAGFAQAIPDSECRTLLTTADVSQARGIPIKSLPILPGVSGCTYSLGPTNIIVDVVPVRDAKDWANTKGMLQNNMYAKPISGIGEEALTNGSSLWFLASNKSVIVTLTTPEEATVCAKLARALDRNLMKIKTVMPPAPPSGKTLGEAMQYASAAAKAAGSGHPSGPPKSIQGFLPDVTICPATQSTEVNRMSFDGENKLSVAWVLVGVNEKQVKDFYLSTLKKKGWTLQSDEFHEAPAYMKDRAEAGAYTGTSVMTFAKNSYTLEIGMSPAGGGVTLSITQTKQ